MKQTCKYRFPCHPQEMFSCTPDSLDQSGRILRTQIIKTIAELSQTYSQKQINKKLFVDIDEDNYIVGLDMSSIIGISGNMCIGSRISVGKLKENDWKNMKIMSD
jgi:hypothetical protein